jgi:DNA-binding Xre family transcriptional regulator
VACFFFKAIARLESGEHHNITLAFLHKVCNAMNVIPEIRFKKVGL